MGGGNRPQQNLIMFAHHVFYVAKRRLGCGGDWLNPRSLVNAIGLRDLNPIADWQRLAAPIGKLQSVFSSKISPLTDQRIAAGKRNLSKDVKPAAGLVDRDRNFWHLGCQHDR